MSLVLADPSKGYLMLLYTDTLYFYLRALCLALAGMWWCVPATLAMQVPDSRLDEAGHFFIETIAPTDYPGGTQNWAILQDHDGILYVANNDGVMVFDGEYWEMIEMPNDSGARSLVIDEDGRIYVGAQDEFGYLAPDASGAMQFVSLLPELNIEEDAFGDVRSMAVMSDGVYFQTTSHLFRWTEQDTLDVWDASGQFGNIYSIDDELYVHQYEVGLMVMEGDSLVPLEGTEYFAGHRVQTLTPQEDGSLMIGTFEGELFTYAGGELSPFETEIADYVRRHDLYRIERLSGGQLVVGTIRGGALLITPSGELVRTIRHDDGLPGITVLSIYEDNMGGVWLGFNAGLARIDVPFAFTRFNHRLGYEGIGVAITRHEGRLYVATTGGIFVLESGEVGEPARFSRIQNTQQQCFDLLSTEGGLLASCSGGIMLVEDGEAVMVAEGLAAYTLYQSRVKPSFVYLGLLDGLGWMQYEDSNWSEYGRMEALEEPVSNIAEDSEGNLWLGTDYRGVLRVSLAGDGEEHETVLQRYGARDGVPGGNAFVNKVGDEIIISTSEGFRQIVRVSQEDGSAGYVIEPYDELTDLLPDGSKQAGRIHGNADDRLWLFVQNPDGRGSAVTLARQDEDGNIVQEDTPLQRISGTDMYAEYVGDDGRVWISTQDGLIRYDEAVPGGYYSEFSVHVRGVRIIGSDSLLYGGYGGMAASTGPLPHDQNALRFTFAAPTFNRGAPTKYRVWLEGFDTGWSGWTEETRRDYTNLPSGEYTFRVQARNAYGLLSDEASYSFTVLSPWYRSWWAIAGFIGVAVALLAGVGYGVYWYRARQLRERNRVLEQRVQERTHALRQRTRTLERANLELRTANEQKSEFLGVAAHDLKNPLSGIIKTASFLIEDARTLDGEPLRKLVQEFVPLIHDSSTRMLQIIDDLLQAHVLEEEANELFLERVDMSELVYSVLRWNRTQAENKDITLYFRPPDRCEAMVDETQMQRVLDNLISNAIKFSPQGKAVQVRLETDGDIVRISVADQGPGLTETDKKKVFGKLQLLSAKPTGGEHSSGLGLYIVKELVENHDGEVYVESEYGNGATFVVEIPHRLQEARATAEPVA